MKKLLLLFLIPAFASCKKNYNCTCTDPSGTVVAITTINDTKENAKTQCIAYYNQHYGTTFNQISCAIK